MQLTLTNERLRELIPNIIHEVKGETPLHDKLSPFLETAETWLENNILGAYFDPPAHIVPLVEKILAHKAFSMAVPMLDVTLSPAGFAVINTDGRAPASKERIERLLISLNKVIDGNLCLLVTSLSVNEEWRGSDLGRWWLGTFLSDLSDVFRFKGQGDDMLETYRAMRSHAMRFEQEVEDQYLGSVLETLRNYRYSLSDRQPLLSMIRQAELRYIGYHMPYLTASSAQSPCPAKICPDEHEVWHLIRPVINRLRCYPDLYERWLTEMGDKFKPEQFKNNIKGGYYF